MTDRNIWFSETLVEFSSVELKTFTMLEWYQNDRSNNFLKNCIHVNILKGNSLTDLVVTFGETGYSGITAFK